MRLWCTATEFVTALAAAGVLAAGGARAAELGVMVRNTSGAPVENAVVVAVPVDEVLRAAPPRTNEIVDQIDMEFVPRVKPIVVGSPVFFPNKDNVRHQVYSFSGAKTFELPLYAGTPAKPIVFDKPGVVVLGCNIHDWMIGYIYVSESPYFAKTGADGAALLRNLPAMRYTVRVWHPQLEGAERATQQPADLSSVARLDLGWSIKLRPEFRIRRAPTTGSHSHY
jgi:plastocyanin